MFGQLSAFVLTLLFHYFCNLSKNFATKKFVMGVSISNGFEGLLRGRMMLMPDTEERYLLTSVRNQCLKRIRHQEMRHRIEAAPAEQPSDAEDEDEFMTDIVEFVVSHLTEQEQRIFHLRFTEGYSYEEIASSEGISRVAVWKHLSHALKEIRNHFNPKGL